MEQGAVASERITTGLDWNKKIAQPSVLVSAELCVVAG